MELGRDARCGDLESRTVEAHRAYLDAFIAWETIEHGRACSAKIDRDRESSANMADACDEAERRKETSRVAFRDLINQLGYLPKIRGIKLPDEPVFDRPASTV